MDREEEKTGGCSRMHLQKETKRTTALSQRFTLHHSADTTVVYTLFKWF